MVSQNDIQNFLRQLNIFYDELKFNHGNVFITGSSAVFIYLLYAKENDEIRECLTKDNIDINVLLNDMYNPNDFDFVIIGDPIQKPATYTIDNNIYTFPEKETSDRSTTYKSKTSKYEFDVIYVSKVTYQEFELNNREYHTITLNSLIGQYNEEPESSLMKTQKGIEKNKSRLIKLNILRELKDCINEHIDIKSYPMYNKKSRFSSFDDESDEEDSNNRRRIKKLNFDFSDSSPKKQRPIAKKLAFGGKLKKTTKKHKKSHRKSKRHTKRNAKKYTKLNKKIKSKTHTKRNTKRKMHIRRYTRTNKK